MKQKFYITTPIYFVNDIPHIGHAYTTIAADVLARYKRMLGNEVYFLTGTDEHGQKIWQAAQKNGENPQGFVDLMAEGFQKTWEQLGITNDDFIRTTQIRHQEVVQKIFSKLLVQGDIYKGQYEGWYCTPCESFWSEMELREDVEGRKLCPDCGRETSLMQEESYFFRLSRYQEKILQHIETNPDFIQPAARRNEILQFIKQGLRDLSITRTAFPWGIEVKEDPKHVIYVWFDALTNYITALGYLSEDAAKFNKYWPANIHLMGKEIVRFHAVIWPGILLALGLPLPERIFGHGWWTVEGEKMSKSLGNVVDPLALAQEFGVDVVRYFLLREAAFGADSNFSRQNLITRFNADLANDLGNLLNRTLTMVEKYFQGIIPDPLVKEDKPCASNDSLTQNLLETIEELPQVIDHHMEQLAFSQGLEAIWQLVGKANNYIEKQAPWKLAKEADNSKLQLVIYNLCETLKFCAYFVAPFMPASAEKMWQQLGLSLPLALDANLAGVKIAKGQPLFPRIE